MHLAGGVRERDKTLLHALQLHLFEVSGVGFRGFRGFPFWSFFGGFGFRVSGFGCRVSSFGFRVSGLGRRGLLARGVMRSWERFRDPGSGIRVSGFVHRNVQRFRGGLVFQAHRLCVSLNSRLESNKEEEVRSGFGLRTCSGDAATCLRASRKWVCSVPTFITRDASFA